MITVFDPGSEIPDADPVRKFVLLVLWQAQEDGATELVLGVPLPDGSGTPFRYKVDGSWYDMSPFPSHIRPDVVTELERMAGLSPDVRVGTLTESVAGTRLNGEFRWPRPKRPRRAPAPTVERCWLCTRPRWAAIWVSRCSGLRVRMKLA